MFALAITALLLVRSPTTTAAASEPMPAASDSAPQDTAPSSTPAPRHAWRRDRAGRHGLEVGFLGYLLTRPGGFVGYSYRVLESPRKRHALVVGADVGAYVWAKHDIGLLVLPRVGWRGRHRSGLQGEASFALGYQASFLPSPNYEVIDGELQRARTRGYSFLTYGPSLGMGWYIGAIGLTPFVRASVMWQYPMFDQNLLRMHWMGGAELRF